MPLSNSSKVNLFLIIAAIGVFTCKQLEKKFQKNMITLDENVRISKRSCISVTNQLFGKAVDSSKFCDCLLTGFYQIIKKDPTLVRQFKHEEMMFQLNGPANDTVNLQFAKCVKNNLLDSTAIFNAPSELQTLLKEKIKAALLQRGITNEKVDKISDCVIQKITGHITIAHFFSEDYYSSAEIQIEIMNCIITEK